MQNFKVKNKISQIEYGKHVGGMLITIERKIQFKKHKFTKLATTYWNPYPELVPVQLRYIMANPVDPWFITKNYTNVGDLQDLKITKEVIEANILCMLYQYKALYEYFS